VSLSPAHAVQLLKVNLLVSGAGTMAAESSCGAANINTAKAGSEKR